MYQKWAQIIHVRITSMLIFGCSILFGDLVVPFPVFATGLSEFNLVPSYEDKFSFACRTELNVLLRIRQFLGLPNDIFCTKNQENMENRVTSLLYSLSKLWCCEPACKRKLGIINAAPVCVSLSPPATQKIISNHLFFCVVNWGWECDVWNWLIVYSWYSHNGENSS